MADNERLQKVLAHAGVASRRKCEEMIKAGRVMVNEKTITELGVKVDPEVDDIRVDGRPIKKEEHIYLLFHKPKGVISSVTDPKGRKTVIDFLKAVPQRVYPVGRLDYDTEGLLLLSNDGEFAQLMTHPSHEISKTYHVTVKGVPHGDVLEKLAQGIMLEDGLTAPAEVEYVDVQPDHKRSILSITIHEGRNRQIRRMMEAVSLSVIRLRRVKFDFLSLEGVARGKFRRLTMNEVNNLKQNASRKNTD